MVRKPLPAVRVMLPLLRVRKLKPKVSPEIAKWVLVLIKIELATRLPLSSIVVPEPNPLANSTSLAAGGTTSPAQLAAVFQLVLPTGAPPSQMVTAANAGAQTKLVAAAITFASKLY